MKLSTMSYYRSGDEIRLKLDAARVSFFNVLEDVREIAGKHGKCVVKTLTIVMDDVEET